MPSQTDVKRNFDSYHAKDNICIQFATFLSAETELNMERDTTNHNNSNRVTG